VGPTGVVPIRAGHFCLLSCGAAKILGETAGVLRFRSAAAYARHNGTAPLPVWSSNRARHRLSRTGNRQLNAALHASR
jgi:transposase